MFEVASYKPAYASLSPFADSLLFDAYKLFDSSSLVGHDYYADE